MNVALRAAAGSGIPDPAQRHVLPGCYTRRNMDGDLPLAPQSSFAATFLTRRLNDASFAMTRGARPHRDELAEERALRASHLSLATTRRADVRSRAQLQSHT